ncbi:MAG: hypothetical protein FWB97_10700, partial [Oscillospiraceae bacterium]|nr:hypothetical protein [Oscillospiraceae bacterium]
DKQKLIAEGDSGMGLLFEKTMVQHETVHPRKDAAWEAFFRLTCAVVFKGLEGSEFDFNDNEMPWDWENLTSGRIYGRTRASGDGRFTLVMEEFASGGVVRDSYPSYSEARASMQADWDAFYGDIPEFVEPYEEKRFDAAYLLWTYLMSPQGSARYPMILMFAGHMASQWQLCQNAVALQHDIELAIGLLLCPIDRSSPEGQLADMFDDIKSEALMVKPPVHGWAVKNLMKHHDLLKECTYEQLEKLYEGMGKWADWFMEYRDEDEDGLPSVVHCDETGLDDSTLFVNHAHITSPDIGAYLVILFEAVGDLANLLGKGEAVANAWYKKSKDLLGCLVDILWNGEYFVGLVPQTREELLSDNIVHYIPAILGDRLPKGILDKLVDDLLDAERFHSPWGLASEAMTSDYFKPSGFGRGCVLPPAMVFICTGLWESSRRDAAVKFAENYCNALIKADFPFFIDPKSGQGQYPGCSWTYCAYMILARMLSS